MTWKQVWNRLKLILGVKWWALTRKMGWNRKTERLERELELREKKLKQRKTKYTEFSPRIELVIQKNMKCIKRYVAEEREHRRARTYSTSAITVPEDHSDEIQYMSGVV
jgi:hypothetical protein